MTSTTERRSLEDGRAGTVRLRSGAVLSGRFVSFGGWLHGEVEVSRGTELREDGHAARVLETVRRSWPLERVARVEWST